MSLSTLDWLAVYIVLILLVVVPTAVTSMEERRLANGTRQISFARPTPKPAVKAEMTPIEDSYTPYADHYQLAYDLALKGLDQQQETLDGIRQRASVLLAAASLVTGFLGGASLPNSTQPAALGPAGWLAIVIFSLSVLILLSVIRPRDGWKFLPNGLAVVKGYVDKQPTASLAQTHYGLAVEMDASQAVNRVQLNAMLNAIDTGGILTGLTIVIWIVELAQ